MDLLCFLGLLLSDLLRCELKDSHSPPYWIECANVQRIITVKNQKHITYGAYHLAKKKNPEISVESQMEQRFLWKIHSEIVDFLQR